MSRAELNDSKLEAWCGEIPLMIDDFLTKNGGA